MSVAELRYALVAFISCCFCASVFAHGNVVAEGDRCLIQIGFYDAHFTIFQPQTRDHREFCEDIPDVTESVFVMEYLHDSLREVPVDFRIIRDRENRGRFVNWDDIKAIGDLTVDTVYYQPPITQQDGVFPILHHFDSPGDYIGIVTAAHPTKDLRYSAVFPFRVGDSDWGYWPLFILLVLIVQANYWVMSGGYSKWREKRRRVQEN